LKKPKWEAQVLAWTKEAFKVSMLAFLFVLIVLFSSSKFSERELLAAGVVFLLGIFWRLNDLTDHIHGIAAKLGYHRTRNLRINELFKSQGSRELTKAEDEELDELTDLDQNQSPATWGNLARVIELLQEVVKLLKTAEVPPTTRT
jgi:hypothetical protein